MVKLSKFDHLTTEIPQFWPWSWSKIAIFDHLTTAISKFWPWSWSKIFDHLTMTPPPPPNQSEIKRPATSLFSCTCAQIQIRKPLQFFVFSPIFKGTPFMEKVFSTLERFPFNLITRNFNHFLKPHTTISATVTYIAYCHDE